MNVSVLVVGLSHKGAALDLLERFSVGASDLPKALLAVRGSEHVREAVILSTCNRIEAYAVVSGYHAGVAALRQFLSEFHHVPLEDFGDRLYGLYEEDAVAHVFSVASGIESMVVGEPQILTQVRRAFRSAQEEGAVGATLSTLFRQAIRVGRRARAETDIARGSSTLALAAASVARDALGSLQGRTVLVVGSGKMGDIAAATLADEGAHVLVANRTQSRADAVARRVGGTAVAMDALEGSIASADVLLTSTGSPDPIITFDMVASAMEARARRPLLVLDLAVPRDVEPSVSTVDGVRLLDMDDLRAAVAPDGDQLSEVERVRVIVAQEVAKFSSWQRTHALAPLLEALNDRSESVRVSELQRASAALAGLSDAEREAVDAVTRSIVTKLLHEPRAAVKELAGTAEGDTLARAVRRLYQLGGLED